MNRAQRRKGISQIDIATQIAARDRQIELVTTKRVMILFANELQSKYGWGKLRINRLMEGVVNTADCINGDYVKYSEIENEMKELGVKI